MSSISVMRFNWLPRPTLYAQAQGWNERQSALREQADILASMSDLFTSAASDQVTGMMNLAAQAALDRTQKAAQAKVQSVLGSSSTSSSSSSSSDSKSSSLTLPDGTVIDDDPNQYLPGGSKLNLSSGTLTLPDGTVIDTATGLKKPVDITV